MLLWSEEVSCAKFRGFLLQPIFYVQIAFMSTMGLFCS